MKKSVLAIAAHPDDIEFCMAGTLMRLIDRGWEAHYFNVANGCCGSTTLSRQECANVRLEEAQKAASLLEATFYPPIRNDLEIFYDLGTVQQVAAVLRQATPQIVLTHATVDYMEDHQNTARLAVTAAFSHGMANFETNPEQPIFEHDLAIYHAQPHGNRTPLKKLSTPEIAVDVSDLLDKKKELLACHASQDNWLDASQGMSSYLGSMQKLNAEVGAMSKLYAFAEGWTQHLHLGFAKNADYNPLLEAIPDHATRL
ncbi:MAG: PIG-L family deacetylase [Planctomycetota bacterium]